MSNQDFQQRDSQGSREDKGFTQKTAKAAGDAYAAASDLAGEAAAKARRAASDTAASLGGHLKEMLNGQVGSGADVVSHVANSVKRAAEELDRNAPQLAGFVHAFADRADGYADDLRGQTVDQLMREASDFTRRQPALVFGLAALAGFLALRTFKSSQPVVSPSIQPGYGDHHARAGTPWPTNS